MTCKPDSSFFWGRPSWNVFSYLLCSIFVAMSTATKRFICHQGCYPPTAKGTAIPSSSGTPPFAPLYPQPLLSSPLSALLSPSPPSPCLLSFPQSLPSCRSEAMKAPRSRCQRRRGIWRGLCCVLSFPSGVPAKNWLWCIISLKEHIWWQQIWRTLYKIKL